MTEKVLQSTAVEREPEGSISAWRVRSARLGSISRPFRAVAKLIEAVQSAIPVGLLNTAEIDHVVRQSYASTPDFYNPTRYRIRHEEELLPHLRSHFDSSSNIRLLDLFCGQGREAAIFAGEGYRVTAVDQLSDVVESGRQHAADTGFEAEFVVADIDIWEPADRDWDVVYTSLWMYSTVPNRLDRIEWARRLGDWVADEGVLVLSVTPVTSERTASLVYRVSRWLSRLSRNKRVPEPGDRFDSGLFWHDFETGEAEAELAEAGFAVLDSHEVRHPTAPCVFYLVRQSET